MNRESRLFLLLGVVALLGLALLGCGQKPPADNAAQGAAPATPTAGTAAGGGSNQLVVYVPCGIAGPYGDICDILRRTHPELSMREKVANVATLKRELMDNKGSCDLYLALGDVEAKALQEAGKVSQMTPIAVQGLGLIVQKGNPLGIKSIKDLASPKVKAICLATPDNSSGFHAQEAFKAAGIWEQVKDKLVQCDMPDLVKGFVSSGKADAGITYSSCLVEVHKPGQEKLGAGQGASTKLQDVGVIDQKLYTPFNVMGVVSANARNPQGAQAFIEACTSAEGQAKLVSWDFMPLSQAPKAGG